MEKQLEQLRDKMTELFENLEETGVCTSDLIIALGYIYDAYELGKQQIQTVVIAPTNQTAGAYLAQEFRIEANHDDWEEWFEEDDLWDEMNHNYHMDVLNLRKG